MPHFVMDCSESVLEYHDEEFIIEQIHLIANSTGLFDEGDIKVRMNPFCICAYNARTNYRAKGKFIETSS